MWNKKDWICLGVSAAAVFGVSMVLFCPSGVTANDPAPVAAAIKVPTLNIDGVSITASSDKDDNVLMVRDSQVFIKPGALPRLEIKAVNTTDKAVALRFSTDIFTSSVNMMSRIPMPVAKPTSQWNQLLSIDLKPNESKLIPLDTNVKIASLSTATLTLKSGDQKVDMLTFTPINGELKQFPALSSKATTQTADNVVGLGSSVPQ